MVTGSTGVFNFVRSASHADIDKKKQPEYCTIGRDPTFKGGTLELFVDIARGILMLKGSLGARIYTVASTVQDQLPPIWPKCVRLFLTWHWTTRRSTCGSPGSIGLAGAEQGMRE